MKKWKKILISLITVFVLAILPSESAILPGTVCVTEAAPRISSSRLRQILTQKDASELANDTLDMAVPYWTDLLKGSGITLRFLGANYAQTECQFRYCGTAIPFLTVRSTAR